MKNFIHVIFTILCVSKSSLAQNDSIFPIMVTINVTKEYTLRFPKSHYSYQFTSEMLDIRTDSVNEDQYDIDISLKNISSKRAFIWLMSCSWFDNFQVNNDYIYMSMPGCDKNTPQCVQFEPGETKLYKTTLSKSVKFENPCRYCSHGPPDVKTTKLGLIVVDDYFAPKLRGVIDYYPAIEDKSMWKIVWSNPLYLFKEHS